MKKTVTLVTCVALLVVAGNISAQDRGFRLEERIPSQTVFFMNCPDISEACRAFEKTAMYNIAQEEEVQQFLKALLTPYSQQICELSRKAEEEIGVSLTALGDIFYGEAALAVVRFDPEKQYLGALLVLEFGHHRATVEQLFKNLSKVGIEVMQTSHQGREISLLVGVPIPLCFAYQGDAFVFSSDPNLLVEALNKSCPDTLANSADFKKARAKLTGEKGTPAFFSYFNLRQIYQQFGAMIPAEVMKSLGVFNIVSFALACNFYEGYVYDGIFLGIEGERVGITKFLHGGPVCLKFAGEVPSHATTFTAMHLDLAKGIAEFEEIVRLADPTGRALSEYREGYEMLEKTLGFSLTEDLAASLESDHYWFQYMPPNGAPMPVAIGVCEVKDQFLFNKWSLFLSRVINLDICRTTYLGQSIYYLSTPMGKLGEVPFRQVEEMGDPIKDGLAGLGFSFSGMGFMFEGNRVYYGEAQNLKTFLMQRDEWRQFLGDSEQFKAVISKVSPKSSLVLYQDFRPMANYLWNNCVIPLARLGEGLLRDAGIPFESALLPQAQTISSHLMPGVTVYLSDEDGILLESYSATGGIIYAVPLVGIASAMAIPAVLEVQMKARERKAKVCLYKLRIAQTMFQMAGRVDQDRDGYGEYGFIQELQDNVEPRGSERVILGDFVPQPFKEGFEIEENGVAKQGGYYFYCYLPGRTQAIGETFGPMPPLDPQSDSYAIDMQESRFTIYAWPVEPGKTGVRAFVITQEGDIYECDSHPYSFWNRPNPEDAYSRGSSYNACNLEGNIASWEYSYNDTFWRPTL